MVKNNLTFWYIYYLFKLIHIYIYIYIFFLYSEIEALRLDYKCADLYNYSEDCSK